MISEAVYQREVKAREAAERREARQYERAQRNLQRAKAAEAKLTKS